MPPGCNFPSVNSELMEKAGEADLGKPEKLPYVSGFERQVGSVTESDSLCSRTHIFLQIKLLETHNTVQWS